jgi:Holliday junction resolvasome RuvABC endonuclease subunit
MIPKESSSSFTIISIDPGSTHVGIAAFNVDIKSLNILDINAWTINGAKLAGKDTWTEELYDNRFSRILAIEEELLRIYMFYKPTIVASESPFINNSFPAAGIALTEVMSAIKRSLLRYDRWMHLYLIPPSSVKNAVFANGAAKKDIMQEKVIQLFSSLYNGNIPIHLLDEHSIDAIAVGYATLKNIK